MLYRPIYKNQKHTNFLGYCSLVLSIFTATTISVLGELQMIPVLFFLVPLDTINPFNLLLNTLCSLNCENDPFDCLCCISVILLLIVNLPLRSG